MSDEFPLFSVGPADTRMSLAATGALPSLQDLVRHAESLVRARSRRRDFLDVDLLGEPAWDMLLILFAAGAERRWVTLAALAALSGVPATSAQRWLTALTERGLAQRRQSWSDDRVELIALQADGYATMHSLLRDAWLTAHTTIGQAE